MIVYEVFRVGKPSAWNGGEFHSTILMTRNYDKAVKVRDEDKTKGWDRTMIKIHTLDQELA